MPSATEFLDEKPSANKFLSPSASDFLVPSVSLDPYQKAYLQSGLASPERVGESDFTSELAKAPEDAANLSRAAITDVAGAISLGPPQRTTFGNIKAAINREPLPVDVDISELAKTNPKQAVAAHMAQSLMGLAPMAALGGLPAATQRLVLGTFMADMLSKAPDTVNQLGEELGKNSADQDPNKIAALRSQLIQTVGFTALPAAHEIGRITGALPGATPAIAASDILPAAPIDSRFLNGVKGTGTNPISPDHAAIASILGLTPEPGWAQPGLPKQWGFQDTQGNSFYVPEGSTAEVVANAYQAKLKGSNASPVRENKGQLRQVGETDQGGGTPGGNDVEQPTPGQSQSVEPGGQDQPNVQGEAAPEIVSMGAANLNSPEFGPNEGVDVTGVAQRVREKVAASGQESLPPTGEGISTPDSVQRGEALLAKNPMAAEAAMEAFEKDPSKAISAEGMALARAKLRKLAFDARRIEEQFGTDSPEYEAAFKARSDWSARVKTMQTEWHKSGMAQQGEQDIDTGSFTGLRAAYLDETGKDFTPNQVKPAKEAAERVRKAQAAADATKAALNEHIATESGGMSDAEKRAFDAANKTVRENAKRLADAEAKSRVAKTAQDRSTAKIQEDAARKALNAANKTVREAAVRAAKAEVATRINPEQTVIQKLKDYLDSGADNYDDMVNKAATDLGMAVRKVKELLARNSRTKFLANEAWRKQEALRRVQQQARRWLKSTQLPVYQRVLSSVPRSLFALKVGFHGTVALGTHAPMVAFQPKFWKTYLSDFGKMYRMVGSPAYYESQVQELLRRPNYITARRAGLVNDPASYEDYNSPTVSQYFGRLSGMGNRGYSVLKILRQDMFDQHWNNLPKTARFPEMAQAIADGVNHATGVIQAAAPKGANIALFAPRLEASRAMWLAGDPIRAADTFLRWNKADAAEKYFAVNQVKEKAWVAGTLFGLLALNQGLLSATDSEQDINFTDPFHSDFLKFKVAGMTGSYGNAMLTMARLPVRLYRIRASDGGKLKNLVYPDEDTYSVLGEYTRSQLSPFASLASTLWLKGDWQNRPLPNSDRPVPKRLRAQGVEPYTWPEFWSEQVLPIPAEEAAREVWKDGLGMSEEQIKSMYKALATISVMAATGARLTDDINVQH